jgi:cytochrome c5
MKTTLLPAGAGRWCLLGAVLLLGAGLQSAPAADPTAGAADTNATAMASAPAPAKKSLTGAELYSIHCNRCHPERYPTERTAAQWKTIMLHMQVRASIPAKQAKLILQYLQDNSGR